MVYYRMASSFPPNAAEVIPTMPATPPNPQSPRPSIQDVARACGVSAATVSRVLNNRPGEVGPRTRERVLDAIRGLNYRPDRSRHTPAPQTLTLGIATGIDGAEYIGPGYYHAVVDSLLAATSALKLNSLLFASHLFYTDSLQSIRTYCDGRCDGLIVIGPSIDNPLVASLQARGFPLVVVGNSGEEDNIAYCDLDNVAAARLAVEEFLGQGHRRIAFCRGRADVHVTWQRQEGYRQALAAHGLQVQEDFLGPAEGMRQWTQAILSLPPGQRPTALLYFSDHLAREALDVIHALGLRVPQEVSVIGIDDQGADRTDPPLTTIRQPYEQIGRCAVEMLLSQIRGDSGGAQRVLLRGELVRRASVAPPHE